MKRLLIASVIFSLLTSCIATHNGTISSSSIGKTVIYEDIAYGVSQTNRFLGLGGFSQDALVLEAKRELIKSRPLKPGEEYSNFTIDFKHTYWPFYIQTKVTVSADVVKYTDEILNDLYSENYKRKLSGQNIPNELFSVGDSVVDKRLNDGIIISIENNEYVMFLYKTETDKVRSKKISIDEIYSKSKPYKGYQVGGIYVHTSVSHNNQEKGTRIIALGLNSLIVKDISSGVKQVLWYNK